MKRLFVIATLVGAICAGCARGPAPPGLVPSSAKKVALEREALALPAGFNDENAPIVDVAFYPARLIESERDRYVITRYLYDTGKIRETAVETWEEAGALPAGNLLGAVDSEPTPVVRLAPQEIQRVKVLLDAWFACRGFDEEALARTIYLPRSHFAAEEDSPLRGKRLARVGIVVPGPAASLVPGPVYVNLSDSEVIGFDVHAGH